MENLENKIKILTQELEQAETLAREVEFKRQESEEEKQNLINTLHDIHSKSAILTELLSKLITEAQASSGELASTAEEINNIITGVKHELDVMIDEEETAKKKALFSGRHILIVEDMTVNAEILRQLLTEDGAITDIAEDGKIALDMFKNSSERYYDAVIMDVSMPNMDGLTATKEIRKLDRPDACDTPIIAMTSNNADEDRYKSKNAGMNAHMSKPVDIDELYSVLLALWA